MDHEFDRTGAAPAAAPAAREPRSEQPSAAADTYSDEYTEAIREAEAAGKPTFLRDWRIESRLGAGEFGRVYRISHKNTEVASRACALKIIPISGGDASGVKREYELLQKIDSPYVMRVEDFSLLFPEGAEEGYMLIRMELLGSISDRKFDEAEAVRLGVQMCEALEVCHEAGIIHRDIKPDNILVSAGGNYKLSDFGVSGQLTKSRSALGTLAGSPAYMASEVVTAHYDHRVDIFSLAMTLYALLNNNDYKSFFEADKAGNYRRLTGDELPPVKGLSKEFERLLKTASQNDPDKRFRSASQMKEALLCIGRGERYNGYDKIGGRRKAGEKKRVSPAARVISAVLALLLIGGGAASYPVITKYDCERTGSGTVSISRYKGGGGDVAVPGKLLFTDVGSIGKSSFVNNNTVRTVSLPDTVTVIEASAFSGCESLERVALPEGLERIEKYAFYGCVSLEEIDLPESVTYIGDSAFEDCGSLRKAAVPGGTEEIPDNCFARCGALSEVVISDGVKKIGAGAFYRCGSLSRAEIPGSVTEISPGAFEGCDGLTVYGEKGSEAERFAASHGYAFIS